MTDDYDDEDEALTPEEFEEIKASNDEIIGSVKKAQHHVENNEMEDALIVLNDTHSECPICQGEIDDAKKRIELVNELCNIEKSASDKKCQKMTNFILDNLSEFVENLHEATNELRDEAYGTESEDSEEYED